MQRHMYGAAFVTGLGMATLGDRWFAVESQSERKSENKEWYYAYAVSTNDMIWMRLVFPFVPVTVIVVLYLVLPYIKVP